MGELAVVSNVNIGIILKVPCKVALEHFHWLRLKRNFLREISVEFPIFGFPEIQTAVERRPELWPDSPIRSEKNPLDSRTANLSYAHSSCGFE